MTIVTPATEVEPISIPGTWNFNYNYYAGDTATRFFHGLRDRTILGVRCPKCSRVLVPARSFCDVCFERTEEWVQVSNEGKLETFTIVTAAFPGLPEPPIVMAYVTLDGADTALINVVLGLDVGDIEATAQVLQSQPRVRAEFVDEPTGRITDFHFRLI